MKTELVAKYLRSIILLLFILSASQNVAGQIRYSFLDSLTGKFNEYCKTYPREEIYIHTDREEYIAGENIWFKMYLFDRQSNTITSGSSIAYIEILNPVNRPIVQKRIKLENGLGPGQALLPDTLSSGRYMIRAYTNWMKNSMPGNCFMKYINVYNPLSPEGFKIKTNHNNSINGSERTVRSTTTPIGGLSLEADNHRKDTLEINIVTDDGFRSVNNNICFLFIHTRGVINYKDIIILPEDTTQVIIQSKFLIPGINHITIFSSQGKPLEEEFLFTPSEKRRPLALNSPDSAGIRDNCVLELDTFDRSVSSSASSSFSISVAPLTGYSGIDFADYMIFGSEFGILPEELQKNGLGKTPPEIVDEFLSGATSNWINWNDILEGNIIARDYNFEKDYHFLSGHLLNRSTLEPDSGQYLFLSEPGKNATFRYSMTDSEGFFNFVMGIDEKPRDIILQPEKTDRNNLIKIESPFSEKYTDYNSTRDTSFTSLPKYISKWSVNSQVNRIYGSESAKVPPVLSSDDSESKRFYGAPDIELILDNYIKLPAMEDVFYELVDGVTIKKKRSGYEITVADPVYNKTYDQPPVLFVDGVVVNDPAVIADIDPDIVEKIDIVRERYIVGDYMFYGLINVITKAGDYGRITLPDYAVRLSYSVTEPVLIFKAPDYTSPEIKQNRIPDFRNTLYWNPSLTSTGNSVFRAELWTSDYPGDYEVNIQGITSEGKPVSIRERVKVR